MAIRSLGKYQLLEQIGQGGMATVFKAIDPGNNVDLAVKILNPVMAQDPQFGKRFEREAEVVMRLKHPNIVPILDYGQDQGYAYLVMPMLKVGSLADRLRGGPLTPLEGGRLVTQLCSALELAHGQGVVHRDVKPSNVLMDEQGNALLADFGLARIHDASVSLTGSALLGTPAYMSPEQAKGEKVGPASDQYSLGVILYQLCTGHLPFEAETPMAVMLKHISEPVPPVRLRSPNVPEIIEKVILKATAKKPEERFQSVTELNTAFQAALAHAQNPFANPAPTIVVPPSSIAMPPPAGMPPQATPLPDVLAVNTPQRKRNRLARLAAVALLLLLLFLACPLSGSPLAQALQESFGPANAGVLTTEDLSGPQLTALAGTIEALWTQVADSGDGTQSPEQIQTAVMGTLIADAGDDGLLLDPSGTPIMILGTATPGPSPTPTKTATPGPSPTPTKTFTPGPTPTPSNTPTITHTPSPGPSPTASDTPTPTPSPTATRTPTPSYTPSPGPSPTASRTLTPTLTRTPTPSPTKTPTPSPTPTKTLAPTKTPTPSQTPTMMASPSGAAPTDTIDPCAGLGFAWSWVDVGGTTVEVGVHNGTSSTVKVDGIYLEWPQENLMHYRFELAGSWIWDQGNPTPPTSASALSGDRQLATGETKPLVAVFETVVPGYYHIVVGFDNSCWIETWP